MKRGGVVLLVAAAACGGDSHHHHDDEHGHGRGAIQVTHWGDYAELFVEYGPLVAGAPSELAIHATRLADFAPVTAGGVEVELTQGDGTRVVGSADNVARTGIFVVELTPTATGACELVILLREGDAAERLAVDGCEVHAKPPEAAEEAGGGIALLKEQQWNEEFATTLAAERDLRPSVRVNAEIKPVAGKEAHLTASLGGRVDFVGGSPVIGTAVARGQLLATVTPPLTGATNRAALSAELAAAEAEHEAAKADEARVARLAEQEAVPQRRVTEAGTRVSVAASRERAARERLREYDASASGRGRGGNAFRLRSPIAGTLVDVQATSGETVEAGAHLFTVMDVSRVWVEGRVFEPDIPAVIAATAAAVRIEGYDLPFAIDEHNGRLVAVGQVLDPHSRTVPIIFEMANPGGLLRIGQFAELEIASGEPRKQLAVPEAAVVTDGGRSVVFVQTSGESFERRFVKPGLRSDGWIAVAGNIAAGDRVVSKGAHIVKLAAAASATPGHGHAH